MAKRRGLQSDTIKGSKALIGMVHVQALPGTPGERLGMDEIVKLAVEDARVLMEAGYSGVIVENMHDVPYVHGWEGEGHGPETTACMTVVSAAVGEVVARAGGRLGVQVLSGGQREALAVVNAVTGGAGGFIRCENFVYAHVADEGLLGRAVAGELLRYRKRIGADGEMRARGRVEVYADIKKKHASHAITADVSIEEMAEAVEFFGADGVIVTGSATGKATNIEDVKRVSRATRLPVLVGSGVTLKDAAALLEHADALIVGSSIKVGGAWRGKVDDRRARALVKAAR